MLSFYEDGKLRKTWNGVSGKTGHQTKEYQYEKSTGPLPEGFYSVEKKEYQEISTSNVFMGIFGRGAWPGSIYSWGKSRIWVYPSNETDVKGRDKFSIHGGTVAGSAGCIDLTSEMDDFAKWYRKNDKDMILFVKHKK